MRYGFSGLPEAARLTWYNQSNSGRFKSHCFFVPEAGECPAVY
jgi:spore germination cell wall hydrolase CwlJ-like protein